jgi:hypothetical protein
MSFRSMILRIVTRSDNAGAKATEQALDGVKKKAGGVFQSMSGAELQGTRFGGVLSRVMKMASLRVGMLLIGLTAMVGLLRKAAVALRAFAKQELSETDLDASLAQFGILTDSYRGKLHGLAAEMQRLTGVSDDTWLKNFAMLTRFGMHSGNVDQVSNALKNLAGLLHGDVNAATSLMQRALEGNYEMFGQYGIRIQRTGDQVRDFAALCEALEKGQGVLEARTQTLAGQATRLKNSWGGLKEAVGGLISDTGIAQWWMNKLSGAVESLEAQMRRTRPPIADVSDALATSFTPSAEEAGESAEETARKLRNLDGVDLSNSTNAVRLFSEQLKGVEAAAEKARRQVEELAVAELEVKLAQIELDVSEGRLSKEEGALAAGRARAGARRGSLERESEAQRQGISSAEDTISAAQARAKEKAEASRAATEEMQFREKTAKDAVREYGVHDLRTKAQIEMWKESKSAAIEAAKVASETEAAAQAITRSERERIAALQGRQAVTAHQLQAEDLSGRAMESNAARAGEAARESRRLETLQTQAKEHEKTLSGLPTSGMAKAAEREQSQADAARARLEQFQQTGDVGGGRRFAPRSHAFREKERELTAQYEKELSEANTAMQNLKGLGDQLSRMLSSLNAQIAQTQSRVAQLEGRESSSARL